MLQVSIAIQGTSRRWVPVTGPGGSPCSLARSRAYARASNECSWGHPSCSIGDSPEGYHERVFTEHAGYGPDGCPFTCPRNARVVNYREARCPVAAELGQRTVKLQVHPTMEPEDAADIGRIVRKVATDYHR